MQIWTTCKFLAILYRPIDDLAIHEQHGGCWLVDTWAVVMGNNLALDSVFGVGWGGMTQLPPIRFLGGDTEHCTGFGYSDWSKIL
jgi:hypothetical protein